MRASSTAARALLAAAAAGSARSGAGGGAPLLPSLTQQLVRRGAATHAIDETPHHSSAPPITPDASASPGGGGPSDGRSSQTTAAVLADKEVAALARDVLRVFEAGTAAEQRRLVERLYDPHAVYENNVSVVKGRAAIIKRFALLPAIASSVKVTYDPPVVLGATTSSPGALDNLASKADVQVEVHNQQQYAFDRSHSMWRLIVLPQGDSHLDCLTRLTLSRDSPRKVLYHHDLWLGNSKWWAPLQKVFAVVETAASTVAGGGSSGDKAS